MNTLQFLLAVVDLPAKDRMSELSAQDVLKSWRSMDHKVLLLIGNALLAERTSGLGIGKIG